MEWITACLAWSLLIKADTAAEAEATFRTMLKLSANEVVTVRDPNQVDLPSNGVLAPPYAKALYI